MQVLCFDIGGTTIKVAVINNEKIIYKNELLTEYKLGHKHVEDLLVDETKNLLEKFQIEGVGISIAGSVNFETGELIVAPERIQEFSGFKFKDLFKSKFNLNCIADNDVNSFAACENKIGNGKNYKNYLVMAVGTGIGGAIVIDNKIYRGCHFNAGEIGRMYTGDLSFEKYASMSSVINYANEKGLSVKGGKDLFNLYDQGEQTAINVVNSFYNELAKGICNVCYTLDLETIFIGGGISKRKTFIDELSPFVKNKLSKGFDVKLYNATFDNDGGVLGAYCNYIDIYNN